jgi:hypothetical protein
MSVEIISKDQYALPPFEWFAGKTNKELIEGLRPILSFNAMDKIINGIMPDEKNVELSIKLMATLEALAKAEAETSNSDEVFFDILGDK